MNWLSLCRKYSAKYSTFNSHFNKFAISLYMAKKSNCSPIEVKPFIYFVSPECLTVHEHISCSLSQWNCRCLNNQFPNHSIKTFCQPCCSALLKSVCFSSGKCIYYPLKVYCYYPLKMYIQQMVLRPGFIDLCRQLKYKLNWCLWWRNLKNSYEHQIQNPIEHNCTNAECGLV